ncbi:class I SAM-dependent methyltransferase [Methylogaea oryzae]|nr:class I SAM-dependent methyltransferase [Methylogaea oryzae]
MTNTPQNIHEPIVDHSSEREFVDAASKNYEHLGSPIEHAVRRAALNVIRGHVDARPSVLELGCSDGYMTSLLSTIAGRHVVVEAAADFIEATRKVVPDTVEFHHSLFEEYEPDDRFDLIVASYILEHVVDPRSLIERLRLWLNPKTGRLFLVVPNIRALSRQLGRAIGVVGELGEITESERIHGHRRSYDRVSFDRDIEGGGAQILARGGLVVKPFANFHFDAMLRQGIIGEDQLRGLELLGTEYPDLCHSIYVVAR